VETGPIWPPASLPSITSASAPERNSFGQRQRGREDDDLGAERLDRLDTALGRNAAGQHDMAHAMLFTDRDQVEKLGVHGDQVDAERLGGERLGPGDLRVEQVGRHRAAGDHAKAARIADRGHEVAFRNPAHRAAQDGIFGAQKGGPARHEGGSLGSCGHCDGASSGI
jgi:hypothetical protein